MQNASRGRGRSGRERYGNGFTAEVGEAAEREAPLVAGAGPATPFPEFGHG